MRASLEQGARRRLSVFLYGDCMGVEADVVRIDWFGNAITLLSPAQRPVQVTEDLPGFWATSYADVCKDMRGRYPKHPWPEDPTQADPTLRAKPRR